ncbi:hypothetical protein OQI89_15505 [Lentilactobacillus diolivorans]|uniref:hypothetical protein n=1 Tax=Lentilactobacillus diolivorans TaxID=179838 RepID=UPI0024691116|nr:hypothetical protein [Lentilactobacillus diolivorans]MDH5107229.1 hypothetical protein [Lentilactobacillus diolivorans]
MNKIFLFLLSFWPLYILIFLKNLTELSGEERNDLLHGKFQAYLLTQMHSGRVLGDLFMVLLIVAIVLLPIAFFRFLCRKERTGAYEKSNLKVFNKMDDGIVSYIMTYIIPLATLEMGSDLEDIIVNIFVFTFVGILFVRLDLVYLCPTILLFNFNIFYDNGSDEYFITHFKKTEIQERIMSKYNMKKYPLSDHFYYLTD